MLAYKRRFLKVKETDAALHFARLAYFKKLRKEEDQKARARRRFENVSMIRSYREGEVYNGRDVIDHASFPTLRLATKI